MLPKANSDTRSSKSATSDPALIAVQYVKGVGPRLGAIFNSRAISNVRDLLFFFPRAYEDRTKLKTIRELKEGDTATLCVQVVSSRKIPLKKFGKGMLEVRVSDESGVMTLKWFHSPKGMESKFTPGTQLMATGQIKLFMNRPEIVHPEITWGASASAENAEHNVGRVVPVYVEIEGVASRTFRKILWEAIQKHSKNLAEDLPPSLLSKHQLPGLAYAVQTIHFPPDSSQSPDYSVDRLVQFDSPAHWRLVYEEFLKFEFLVLRQRLKMQRETGQPIGREMGEKALKDLITSLPFSLTGDQKKAIQDVLEDLKKDYPMNRLIQGDVGSGKTAVALLTAGAAIAEGGQVTLMAPTEILAEQHFKNSKKFFGDKLNVCLLTGKTSASERSSLSKRLLSGEPMLLIGTHALLEENVEFKNLVYVLIDEQHRFGVEQRRVLRQKGKQVSPHTLVLTATPIPRTLALTAYGDLATSTIREMPPGRTPVITKVIRGDARLYAYEKIRDQLKLGRQAYFIFPLVNDSESEGYTHLRSAVAEAERLGRDVFPEFKVGLLHGQLKADEKAKVMDQFQKNEIQVLVSTTVIEVGVDVPNATVMAVDHSERFGLSQLHQLRGRVGRGSHQSYCFYFSAQKSGETSRMRLEVLEETTDGFKIAEADLQIRGPGEFLGTRQAGALPFRLADLVRDQKWLFKAREDAIELLKSDPELSSGDHLPLRRYFEREGKLQFDRLKTS